MFYFIKFVLYSFVASSISLFPFFNQINIIFVIFFAVNELTTEGKNAIDSPGSPALPDLLPEDYILGNLILIFNIYRN